MTEPRVFTIPPGAPFLATLVDGLLGGEILDGFQAEDLASAVIYVPTRRAAGALAAELAARGGGRAQLLPRIVPLGEADEAEFELTGGAPEAGLEGAEALAPPIQPLERRLILTRLIQRWVEVVDRVLLKLPTDAPLLVPASPADAVALAADLETLMDAFATEEVPWSEIGRAVDADYSTYFELTLDFVRIAAERWPDILAERMASDPARRGGALLAAEAKRLSRERPRTPVIAAGSTGSIPATATLLAAIASLPGGAVVLPGLDTHLDEPSWRAIGTAGADGADLVHGHPQASLRRLMDRHLRLDRGRVRRLGQLDARAEARARLLSEALRPADTTHRWATLPPEERVPIAEHGAAGIALVEAADEREEALAAAVALREVLETPGRTAALVTPDRALAARVAAELARWDLVVEDSAGVPLADAPAGRLARLAAEAAADDFRPVRVLALLAHPLVRLGLDRATVERAARTLEIGVLRGPAPGPGLAGLEAAMAASRAGLDRRFPRPRRRLTDEDWAHAALLLRRLEDAFAGFDPAELGDAPCDLVRLSEAHRATVDRLLAGPDKEAADAGPDGEALAALFDDLQLSDSGGVAGRMSDYPSFFAALARQRTLSPERGAGHPRLAIWGLLEARLLAVDRVVLGGLDEGVWPPRTEADAFLNRPMRAELGLAPPERRIGQTAHDFVQALGTRDAVVTRAAKRDGSPMVPSRFLQRMKAFCGEAVWAGTVAAGERYRRLARALDAPRPGPRIERPAPCPDPALFPRALSVTEVETLVRDPYAIFARHVLRLEALGPLAGIPGAAERGTIVHEVLARFAEAYPDQLPADALAGLLQRGENAFGAIEDAYPGLHAEWWPRFQRLATAFVVWEEARRADLAAVHPERSGSLALPLPDGGTFTLKARADRIERRLDGTFALIDYKTGQPPGLREVCAGFSPQLTLEAAMLMRGAFKGLPPAAELPELLYVHTSGGRTPLDPKPIKPPPGDARSLADIVDEHWAKLERLILGYVRGENRYLARPFPKFARKYSETDHLARVKEWSGPGALEDAG